MPAPATPAKGHMHSTWPTPPFGGAVQALLHVQRALRLSLAVFAGSSLDARAWLKLSSNRMVFQPVGRDAIATSRHTETFVQEKRMS